MSTEHWIAHWDHGKVAVQAHVVPTAESAEEHRANGWRVEGPFVPADELRAIGDLMPAPTQQKG